MIKYIKLACDYFGWRDLFLEIPLFITAVLSLALYLALLIIGIEYDIIQIILYSIPVSYFIVFSAILYEAYGIRKDTKAGMMKKEDGKKKLFGYNRYDHK